MAIHHAGAGEPINVQPFGAQLLMEQTVALFKSEDLELIRLVLLAGKSFPTHKVSGEVTIQCIEGTLDITVEGTPRTISAGQLLFLSANALHSVTAIENSSALVTIVLRK